MAVRPRLPDGHVRRALRSRGAYFVRWSSLFLLFPLAVLFAPAGCDAFPKMADSVEERFRGPRTTTIAEIRERGPVTYFYRGPLLVTVEVDSLSSRVATYGSGERPGYRVAWDGKHPIAIRGSLPQGATSVTGVVQRMHRRVTEVQAGELSLGPDTPTLALSGFQLGFPWVFTTVMGGLLLLCSWGLMRAVGIVLFPERSGMLEKLGRFGDPVEVVTEFEAETAEGTSFQVDNPRVLVTRNWLFATDGTELSLMPKRRIVWAYPKDDNTGQWVITGLSMTGVLSGGQTRMARAHEAPETDLIVHLSTSDDRPEDPALLEVYPEQEKVRLNAATWPLMEHLAETLPHAVVGTAPGLKELWDARDRAGWTALVETYRGGAVEERDGAAHDAEATP